MDKKVPPNSSNPLVSIVIPAYNRANLIGETLNSISAQTLENWECIIVDDGSTDGTSETIISVATKDPRFRLIHRHRLPNGAPTCRNIGLENAHGQFVIFLDSDDLLAPHCLENRVRVMMSHPEIDFAVFPTWVFNISPDDKKYFWNAFSNEDALERFLKVDAPWQTVGPIWKKEALKRLGFWDERAKNWQDWEFHLRALAMGLTHIQIPEPDAYYRESAPGSISYSGSRRRLKLNLKRILPRTLEEVVCNLRKRGELTRYRRRLIAAQYYRHSLMAGSSMRSAQLIWFRAKQAKVINPFEFYTVLIFWRTLGKVPTRVIVRLFPELKIIRSSRTFKSSSIPVLNSEI